MSLIICSECGKEISDKATNCPHCGAPIQPTQNTNYYQPQNPYTNAPVVDKKKSNLSMIGFILSFMFFVPVIPLIGLILCIVGINKKEKKVKFAKIGIGIAILSMIIGFASCGSSETESTQNIESSTEAVKTENNTIKNEEIVKTDSVDETVIEENQEKDIYYVGDAFENKYIKMTYLSGYEFEDYDQYNAPKDGNIIICAEFEIENIGSSDQYISYIDFNGYADGYEVEQNYAPEGSGLYFSLDLSAGRKGKGIVAFEVPEDAEEIQIEFSPNIWTSEKVVFSYK